MLFYIFCSSSEITASTQVSIFSVIGRLKSHNVKICYSIFTISSLCTKKSYTSSSSSIIGGVISLILAAREIQAKYSGLVHETLILCWLRRQPLKISMARKTVSGANQRKFLCSIIELTLSWQTLCKTGSSFVLLNSLIQFYAFNSFADNAFLIMEEINIFLLFDGDPIIILSDLRNSMDIGNKWRIKKTLFKNNNSLYAKAITMDQSSKPITLAIIPYQQEIQQVLQKHIQKINQAFSTSTGRKILLPNNLSVQPINKLKTFLASFEEEMMPASVLLKHHPRLYHHEIIETAISGILALQQLHSCNFLHKNISLNTCYFFNRIQKNMERAKHIFQCSTYFGINILDIEQLLPKVYGVTEPNPIKMIYQSRNISLGFNATPKDDIQSLLYIIFHIISHGTMFSHYRYMEKWKNAQALRKWKLTQMYHQMLEITPFDLSVFIELYLYLQELPDYVGIDYGEMIKKLKYAKENLSQKQDTDPLKQQPSNGYSIKKEESVEQDLIEMGNDGEKMMDNIEKAKNGDGINVIDFEEEDIFEEDIQLQVRSFMGK